MTALHLKFAKQSEFEPDPAQYELVCTCVQTVSGDYLFRWGLRDQSDPHTLNWAPGGKDDYFEYTIFERLPSIKGKARKKKFLSVALRPSGHRVVGYRSELDSFVASGSFVTAPGAPAGISFTFDLALRIERSSFVNTPKDWAAARSALNRIASRLSTLFPGEAGQLKDAIARVSVTLGDDLPEYILATVFGSSDLPTILRIKQELDAALKQEQIAPDAALPSSWLTVGDASVDRQTVASWVVQAGPTVSAAWARAVKALDGQLPTGEEAPTIRTIRRSRDESRSFAEVLAHVSERTSLGAFKELGFEIMLARFADVAEVLQAASAEAILGDKGAKALLSRTERFVLQAYRDSYRIRACTPTQKKALAAALQSSAIRYAPAGIVQPLVETYLARRNLSTARLLAGVLGAYAAAAKTFDANHEVRMRMVLAATVFQRKSVIATSSRGIEEQATIGALSALEAGPVALDPNKIWSFEVKWIREPQGGKPETLGRVTIGDCANRFVQDYGDSQVTKGLVDNTDARTVETAFWEIVERSDSEAPNPKTESRDRKWIVLGDGKAFSASEIAAHNAALALLDKQIWLRPHVVSLQGNVELLLARLTVPISNTSATYKYVQEKLTDSKWADLRRALLSVGALHTTVQLRTTSGDGRIAVAVRGVASKPVSQPVPGAKDDNQTAFTSFTLVPAPLPGANLVQGSFKTDAPIFASIPSNPETAPDSAVSRINSIDRVIGFNGALVEGAEKLVLFDVDVPSSVSHAWPQMLLQRSEDFDGKERGRFSYQGHVHPGLIWPKPVFLWMFSCFRSGEWGFHRYPVRRDENSPFEIPVATGPKSTPEEIPLLWAQPAPPVDFKNVEWHMLNLGPNAGLYQLRLEFENLQDYVLRWITRENVTQLECELFVFRRAPNVILKAAAETRMSSNSQVLERLQPYLGAAWFAEIMGDGWEVLDVQEFAAPLSGGAVPAEAYVCGGWEYKVALVSKRPTGSCYIARKNAPCAPVRLTRITGKETVVSEWLAGEAWPLEVRFDLSAAAISKSEYLSSSRRPESPGAPRFNTALPKAHIFRLTPLERIAGKRMGSAAVQLAASLDHVPESGRQNFLDSVRGYIARSPDRLTYVAGDEEELAQAREDFQRYLERLAPIPSTLSPIPGIGFPGMDLNEQSKKRDAEAIRAIEARAAVRFSYYHYPVVDQSPSDARDTVPIVATKISRCSARSSLPAMEAAKGGTRGVASFLRKQARVLSRPAIIYFSTWKGAPAGVVEVGRKHTVQKLNGREPAFARIYSDPFEVVGWQATGVKGRYKGVLQTAISKSPGISQGALFIIAPKGKDEQPPILSWMFGVFGQTDFNGSGALISVTVFASEKDAQEQLKASQYIWHPAVESEIGTILHGRTEDESQRFDVLERGVADSGCYVYRHVGPGTLLDQAARSNTAPRLSEPYIEPWRIHSSIEPAVPQVIATEQMRWGVSYSLRNRTDGGEPYFSDTVKLEFQFNYSDLTERAPAKISSENFRASAIDKMRRERWSDMSGEEVNALCDWFGGIHLEAAQAMKGSVANPIEFPLLVSALNPKDKVIQLFLSDRESPVKPGPLVFQPSFPVREYTEWSMRVRSIENPEQEEAFKLESEYTDFVGPIRPMGPEIIFEGFSVSPRATSLGAQPTIKLDASLHLVTPSRVSELKAGKIRFDGVFRPGQLVPFRYLHGGTRTTLSFATEFAGQLSVQTDSPESQIVTGQNALRFLAQEVVPANDIMQALASSLGAEAGLKSYQVAIRQFIREAGDWRLASLSDNSLVGPVSYPKYGEEIVLGIRMRESISPQASAPLQQTTRTTATLQLGPRWKPVPGAQALFSTQYEGKPTTEEAKKMLAAARLPVKGAIRKVGSSYVADLSNNHAYRQVVLRFPRGTRRVEIGFIV